MHGLQVVVPTARSFSPSTFWEDVASCGVTWWSAPPGLHSILLQRRVAWQAAGCPRLRLLAASCGTRLMDAELRSELRREFGAPVVEGFGMPGEACLLVAVQQMNMGGGTAEADEEGQQGQGQEQEQVWGKPALGMELAVVPRGIAADVLPACAGEGSGELLIRGPAVCSGYHGRKEGGPRGDGWFGTGLQATLR